MVAAKEALAASGKNAGKTGTGVVLQTIMRVT